MNYKDVTEAFLQKSMIVYLKSNEERKKLIEEYENKYQTEDNNNVNKEENNSKKDDAIEPIYEQEDILISNRTRSEINIDDPNTSINNENKSQTIYPAPNNFGSNKYFANQKLSSYRKDYFDDYNDKCCYHCARFRQLRHQTSDQNITQATKISLFNNDMYIDNKSFEEYDNDSFNIVDQNFNNTIDAIINCIEENHLKFTDDSIDGNPLLLLKKLKNIKNVTERNEIIELIDAAVTTDIAINSSK